MASGGFGYPNAQAGGFGHGGGQPYPPNQGADGFPPPIPPQPYPPMQGADGFPPVIPPQPYPPVQGADGFPPVMPAHGGGIYPSLNDAQPPTVPAPYPQIPSGPGYQAQSPQYPCSPQGTGSAYPPQGGAYPPQGSAYPPQGSAYPPQPGTYPPQGGAYPPQGGAYPPPDGAYPPQGGAYPPQGGAYPPQGGAYPPQSGAYPPQGDANSQMSSAYTPQSSACPPQVEVEGSCAKSSQMVKLHVSASDLPKMDLFSKSDPMCVLYTKAGDNSWMEIGRTESIKNNHNPMWNKTFNIDFLGEEVKQVIKFEVYDADSSTQTLKKQDFMGMIEVDLAEIVNDNKFSRALKGLSKSSKASLSVNAERLKTVTMQMSGINLKDMDTFSKSDPFFALKCKDPYGYFKAAYTSEKIENNLNPRWKRFSIVDSELCKGDYRRPLKIMVFDWDSSGNHDLIGECDVTLEGLLSAFQRGSQLDLIHPKKKKGGRMGMVRIDLLEII